MTNAIAVLCEREANSAAVEHSSTPPSKIVHSAQMTPRHSEGLSAFDENSLQAPVMVRLTSTGYSGPVNSEFWRPPWAGPGSGEPQPSTSSQMLLGIFGYAEDRPLVADSDDHMNLDEQSRTDPPVSESPATGLSASWGCASWPYAVAPKPVVTEAGAPAIKQEPGPDSSESAVVAVDGVTCKRLPRRAARQSTKYVDSDGSPDDSDDSHGGWSGRASKVRKAVRAKPRGQLTSRAATAQRATSSVAAPGTDDSSTFLGQSDFNFWVREAFLLLKKRLNATGLSLHVRSLKYSDRRYTLVSRFSRKQKGFRRYYHLSNFKAQARMEMEAHVREMRGLRASWMENNGGSDDEEVTDESPIDGARRSSSLDSTPPQVYSTRRRGTRSRTGSTPGSSAEQAHDRDLASD